MTRPPPLISIANGVPKNFDPGWALSDSETRNVVLDDDTMACIELRNPGDRLGTVYLWRSPFSIVIEGAATDDELLAAANHIVPAETGFEIEGAGLPSGVEPTGGGWGVGLRCRQLRGSN